MRINDPRAFEREEKQLLDFARSYLSDAFPNPGRQGCPPDAALRTLAFKPKESEPIVTEHLAGCSPCFRRYTELLAQLKSQMAGEGRWSWNLTSTWSSARSLLTWRALVCALFIAIGASLMLNRIRVSNAPPHLDTHRAPNPVQPLNPAVAYSPFSVDLRENSPTRGSEPSTTGPHHRVRVPSSPLYLTLTLPFASEERPYTVRMTAGGHTFWSKSAEAHLLKGETLIRVKADFRQIPAGSYNLEVESSTGIYLVQPISIETALPNRSE
jgi:hypothetical protein